MMHLHTSHRFSHCLTGVSMDSGILHPFSNLFAKVEDCIPLISAHSARHLGVPLWTIILLFLLFRDCSFGVAHLQFDLQYEPLLSIRSIEHPDGHSTISDKKESNEFHSSLIDIPLPPYLRYAGDDGFLVRDFIPSHEWYVRDLDSCLLYPCVVADLMACSRQKQPQEVVFPDLRFHNHATILFPQSHLHTNFLLGCPPTEMCLSDSLSTTRRENLVPIATTILLGMVEHRRLVVINGATAGQGSPVFSTPTCAGNETAKEDVHFYCCEGYQTRSEYSHNPKRMSICA